MAASPGSAFGATLRRLVVFILVVVVGFGAYFFLYIQRRTAAETEHHLRLLLNSSDYAADAFDGLLLNFTTAVSPDSDAYFSRATGKAALSSKVVEAESTSIDHHLKLISALKEFKNLSLSSPQSDTLLRAAAGEPRGTMRTAVALDVSERDPRLVLIGSRDDLRPPRTPRPGKQGSPGILPVIFVRLASLRSLLASTLPIDSFEGVVLARSNGDVLLQEGHSHIRLRRISLRSRPGRDSSEFVLSRGSGSQVSSLQIAGESYKMFVQPLRLPAPVHALTTNRGAKVEGDDSWLIVGFMTTAQFRALTMEISPNVVLVTILLVVLGLLAMPFLKVRFAGPCEAFRRFDVVLLALAVLIASSLGTIALLYGLQAGQSARTTGENLGDLSHQVIRQLDTDLAALDTTLSSTTQAYLKQGKTLYGVLGRKAHPIDSLRCSPFFESLYWIDRNGTQQAKWGIREVPTPYLNLMDRQYVKDPLHGALWRARDLEGPLEPGRLIQSIRSKTTGWEAAVLARRVKPPVYGSLAFNQPVIWPALACIESRLRSVISPVFPPGYQFAIVDRDGMVQFHSNKVSNLREYMFRDLGCGEAARRAVASPTATTMMRTTYQTRPVALQITPISGTPWSLIVLADTDRSRAWLIEVLGLALGAYLFYLVLLLAVMLVFHKWPLRARPGEARRIWYWPREECRRRYQILLGVLILVVLPWAGVLAGGSTRLIWWVSFATPLAIMTAFESTLISCRWQRPRAHPPGKPAAASLYKLTLAGVVLTAGVLPAVGMFRAAFAEVSVVALKRQQLELLNATRRRQQEMLARYASVPLALEPYHRIAGNIYGDSGSGDTLGYYHLLGWSDPRPTSGFGREGPNVTLPTLGGAIGHRFMGDDVEPERSDSCYHWSKSDDGRYQCWLSDPAGLGFVGTGLSSTDTTHFQVLASTARPERFAWVTSPAFWIILVLLACVLYVLIWVAVRWSFLEGIDPPRLIEGAAIAQAIAAGGSGTVRRAILLRFRLPKHAPDDWDVIGPSEIRAASNARELIDRIVKSVKHNLLLCHFDYGLSEPAIRDRKLELLEGLDAQDLRDRRVVIESGIEPLYFITTQLYENSADHDQNAITVERWAEVLQGYARLRTRASMEAPLAEVTAQESEAPASTTTQGHAVQAIANEGRANKWVSELSTLIEAERLAGMSEKQAIEAFGDMAQAHYRRIWMSCSIDERLLLLRVATDGFVNRNAVTLLKPLLRRGLVVLDPNCRIMNESFRRFIRSAEPGSAIARWEAHGGSSTWQKLRTPMFTAASLLGLFFFATQRGVFDRSLGLLATIVASGSGVVNLIGAMSRLRQPGSPTEK